MSDASANPIAAAWTRPLSQAAGLDAGRARRRTVPRSALSQLTTTVRDPLRILDEQNQTRLSQFVPLRIERMSQSPFAFYRGTAGIMAADLAADPHTGILVASCGDAHVANFGFYASPQRSLVFDLNDFDEAAWAPWEWDLKRLVTSIVISGQSSGRTQSVIDDAVLIAVQAYSKAINSMVTLTPMQRYFTHFEIDAAAASADKKSRAVLERAVREATKRTGDRAAQRLTQRDAEGRVVFVDRPPTMIHPEHEILVETEEHLKSYVSSANTDIQLLLANYVASDVVRRVVGVGSVGTRCYLIAFQAGDESVLLLQAKEADESVLVQYGHIAQPPSLVADIETYGEGARVVALQRVLQAFSDPFLGYLRGPEADLYVRQFHDMKGGVDSELLPTRTFKRYGQTCAATLARAHAQSPHAVEVAGYIGDRGSARRRAPGVGVRLRRSVAQRLPRVHRRERLRSGTRLIGWPVAEPVDEPGRTAPPTLGGVEHMEPIFLAVAVGFEALGALAMVVGTIIAIVLGARALLRGQGGEAAFQTLRTTLGGAILMGLEVLVAADLIRTITSQPSIEDALILGLIVVIRTILSMSIQIEIEGTLPWKRALTTSGAQVVASEVTKDRAAASGT